MSGGCCDSLPLRNLRTSCSEPSQSSCMSVATPYAACSCLPHNICFRLVPVPGECILSPGHLSNSLMYMKSFLLLQSVSRPTTHYLALPKFFPGERPHPNILYHAVPREQGLSPPYSSQPQEVICCLNG